MVDENIVANIPSSTLALFGFAFQFFHSSIGSSTTYVDNIRMTVYYTIPALIDTSKSGLRLPFETVSLDNQGRLTGRQTRILG